MATLYRNFLSGLLDADPGAGGTSLSSPGFANLPVVAAPNTMWLTLDPDAANGASEIVQITAHTASATTVTVVRGQQSTTARAHPVNTEWAHANTQDDLDDVARKSLLSTKGDLFVRGNTSVGVLGVGANGTIPVADSADPQGIAYKGGLVELNKVTDPGSSPFTLMDSIPGDYQDLLITVAARIVGPSTTHRPYGLQFNSDTGTNYSRMGDEVDGAGTRSVPAATGQTDARAGYASDVGQCTNVIWIPDYAGTSGKVIDSRGLSMFGGAVGADTLKFSFSSRWSNSAAITRIVVTYATADGNFSAGTTFTLYGVGS